VSDRPETAHKSATPGPLILLIEDETALRRYLRPSLAAHGYRLVEATKGEEGLDLAAQYVPDIVLLDLGLPDIDGLDVTRRLRQWSTAPIIVLSARGQEADKVAALDAGADDYLTKPFGFGELLARIRVVLRRMARLRADQTSSEYASGPLRVDLAARRVFVNGKEAHLTAIEYKLLAALIHEAGRLVTHRQLLHAVWGPGHASHTEYVRVYMAHLRRKLGEDPARPKIFRTEIGVGYRLIGPEDARP
jgi:two-component system KDP operon response regulator KdpE